VTDERAAENSRSDEPADGSDDVVAAEVVEDGQSDGPQPEREWWDDPGMPWQRKPTRSDIACLTWIGVLGILSLAMLPLRAWLLGSPDRLPWLVGLIGSRSGTALLGSVTRVGGQLPVVWPILLGVVMSIKLDWTYWWAGKLWGRGMIEVWAGQSPRAGRNYARAERWANKLGWLGMFVAYVPIPLPLRAVIFVLSGAQGMSWKKFMLLDFAACLVWLIGYFYLGYFVGDPAVKVLEYYAKVANYVAIGLVIAIVAVAFMRSSRKAEDRRPRG